MSITSPLENLSPLAKAGVPLLHVCDPTEPWFNDHTQVVEPRYKELGGQVDVIINEKEGRNRRANPGAARAATRPGRGTQSNAYQWRDRSIHRRRTCHTGKSAGASVL